MSVLVELEALQQKRQQHADAIKKIDEELARVRMALSIPSPVARPLKREHVHLGVRVSITSGTADLIFEELAKQEPLTARDIANRCARSYQTINKGCFSLMQQGKLVGERGAGVGRPMYYARSREGLANRRQASPQEGEDELGPPTTTSSTVEDGTTSDRATSQSAVSSAPVNGSGIMSGTNG